MTSLDIIARRGFEQTAKWAAGFGLIRLSVLLALTVIAACSTDAAIIIVQSLSDAFLQVTVFVAATLVIFYFIEAWYRIDVTSLLSRFQVWQVPIAAGLGVLPGCGGAIMVITQYIRGGISFGSVVSVLTSTMGDAAFLLLATAPEIGISIFGIGFLVGIASGYTVDAIHGNGFLRQRSKNPKETSNSYTRRIDSRWWRYLWTAFLIPGLIFGGFVAFQADTSVIFGVFMGIETVVWVGLGGAIVSLMLWGITPPTSNKISPKASGTLGWASASTRRLGDAPARVVGDTCFVTVWVVFAYLIYELGIYFLEIDLKQIFQIWAPLVPFIAILVGFIPGCGPQLVVATMYLNGLVPFSAEVGNAISNDGDALFPAIAMVPKAAIIATLYSAFPALLVAYCYYWLFE
ncbi:MAG: putative manganese transporter [Pseudomonadota bacterium]|nr:putative manganese transporter [Pseudomonadota bacterium]